MRTLREERSREEVPRLKKGREIPTEDCGKMECGKGFWKLFLPARRLQKEQIQEKKGPKKKKVDLLMEAQQLGKAAEGGLRQLYHLGKDERGRN